MFCGDAAKLPVQRPDQGRGNGGARITERWRSRAETSRIGGEDVERVGEWLWRTEKEYLGIPKAFCLEQLDSKFSQ